MKTTTTTIKLTVVTNSNYSMEIVINKPQQWKEFIVIIIQATLATCNTITITNNNLNKKVIMNIINTNRHSIRDRVWIKRGSSRIVIGLVMVIV